MTAFRLLLASGLTLAVLATVAWVDHDRKGAAMHDASVAAWLCAHKGTRCGRADQHEVERRWRLRERGYAAGLGISALVGAFALAGWRRSVSEGR